MTTTPKHHSPETANEYGEYVGQPATILLYTDTTAAVVTRVNAKGVSIARVETGEMTPDMACDAGAYGLRVEQAEGILDKITGPSQAYRRVVRSDGTMIYTIGSIKAVTGRSVTRIDRRY